MANEPATPPAVAPSDVWSGLLPVMGGSAALGGSLRGLQGLWQLANRNLSPPPRAPTDIGAIPLPYQVEEEEEKIAQVDPAAAPQVPQKPQPSAMGTLFDSHPLAMPVYVLGATGAAAGGYKLMDYLLDKRREQALQNEVDSARQEFEGTLQTQVPPHPPLAKLASCDKLDEIYDLLEKKALIDTAIGTYLTAAIPLALLSGAGGWHMRNSQRRAALVDSAAKERRKRYLQNVPPEIQAQPIPAV